MTEDERFVLKDIEIVKINEVTNSVKLKKKVYSDTENKRFTYMEQFNGFCDVYDNGKILSCMRLEYVEKTVKLLNELYKENKELKKELKGYKKIVGKVFWCEND